jgi:molybdopterin-guanine dinucleotide biosynthesis adapter protein
MPPFISIVGKSGSGKTTFIEKLIPELKRRGHRVGIIKHAHHGFEIDKRGKDSSRFQAIGADTVLVASPFGFAMIKNSREPSLEELSAYMTDLDLVITEGYKHGDKPKIEVCRAATQKTPLYLDDGKLMGFVTDTAYTQDVPTFGLDDISQIADLIEQRLL